MAAAPTGIAFLAVSFASTSEMMSFGSLFRMSGALRISRLISESYIPAINTSFTIDWVKSHRSRQELLVYPQVSAFPCTLAANVLNVSSRLCLICISSDSELMEPLQLLLGVSLSLEEYLWDDFTVHLEYSVTKFLLCTLK